MTIRSLSEEISPRKPKPVRAVVFELDQVLIDSKSIDALRQQRKWGEVYSSIPRLPQFPGVESLMKLLGSRGVAVGIVSARPGRYCELVAKRWKWPVKAAVTFEDKQPRKPAPDAHKLCLQKLGALPENAAAVCWDAQDVEAARAAGLYTIAAAWDPPENSGAASASPRARCANAGELEQLLKRLFEL